MTIPDIGRADFTGDATAGPKPFGFKIADQDDLIVAIRDTTDVTDKGTVLTRGATNGYTVAGVGIKAGGSITLTGTYATSVTADFVGAIVYAPSGTQPLDTRNSSTWNNSKAGLEDELDKLAAADIFSRDQHSRSMHFSETHNAFDAELPALQAGDALIVNSSNTAFERNSVLQYITATEAIDLDNLPSTYSAQNQDFVAGVDFTAGTSTTITLTHDPVSVNQTNIYFDGVHQSQSTYTYSVPVITFDEAIPASVTGISVIVGIPTGALSGDVVGPASSTDNAVARFDLITGKLLQNGVVLHSDTGQVTGVTEQTQTGVLRLAKGADVASATALTLGVDGNSFDITGTTTITSIATLGIGTQVQLHFDGILTFTHHATDLILTGGANITTAAGDIAVMEEYATGDWRCVSYTVAANGPKKAVTSAAVIGDNLLTRGDGTGRGVQNTGITIDDSDNITNAGTINGRNISNDGTKLDASAKASSTGILTGGIMTTGAGAAQYSIADGTAQVVSAAGVITPVSWTGESNRTPTNIATQLITFVGVNSSGVIVEQSGAFTNTQTRTIAPIGVAVHVDNTTVDAVNNEQYTAYNAVSQLNDLVKALGLFNGSGNVFSANGANLNINKSAGTIFGTGVNYAISSTDPNVITTANLTALSFQYRFNDGSNGVTGTAFDPTTIDDGAGGTTALSTNNKWSVQRVYVFTSNNVKIQRGVAEYSSKDNAIAGIQTEAFVTEPSIAANGVLRGYIITQKNCVSLSNTARAVFIEAARFQSSTGGIGSIAETLQDVYDNSSNPEIVTNTTLGAVSIKRGSAADTDNVLEIQNAAGTNTFEVTGEGDVDIAQDLTVVGDATIDTNLTLSASFQNVAYTPIGVSTKGIQLKTGYTSGEGSYGHTGITFFGDEDNFAGVHAVHDSSTDCQLVLVSNGVEAMRLDSSQNVNIANLLDLSGASAGQIKFPATQNASSDANTLDDYEEGTFTPNIQDNTRSDAEGQTTSAAVGTYTKVGDRVYFSLRMTVSSIGTLTPANGVVVSGMPYTSGATANTNSAVTVGYGAGLAITAGHSVTGRIDPNSTVIQLSLWSATTGVAAMLVSEASASGDFIISGHYGV